MDKMPADNTSVYKDKDFDNFSDLLGDNKSITMIKMEKLKAPDDMEDMEEMDDDIQDKTSVDVSDIINKLMCKLGK